MLGWLKSSLRFFHSIFWNSFQELPMCDYCMSSSALVILYTPSQKSTLTKKNYHSISQKKKLTLREAKVAQLASGSQNSVLSTSPMHLSTSFHSTLLGQWGSNMTEKSQKGDETSKHLKMDKRDLLCLLSRNYTQNQLWATHVDASFPKPICTGASSLMQLSSTFPQTLKLGLCVLSTFWWGKPIPT